MCESEEENEAEPVSSSSSKRQPRPLKRRFPQDSRYFERAEWNGPESDKPSVRIQEQLANRRQERAASSYQAVQKRPLTAFPSYLIDRAKEGQEKKEVKLIIKC